jgi:hypothetical protein
LLLVAAALLGGCAGSDVSRREDILRQRQYELDRREARLRAAEQRFRACMAEKHPGESTGLERPVAARSGGGEGEGAGAVAAGGGALTMEALEELQRIERLGRPAIIACYTAELERRGNKELQGKVVVRILVGTNGVASQIQIGESTLEAPRVHSCIVKTIRTWELPRITAPSWYSTTFDFSPAY